MKWTLESILNGRLRGNQRRNLPCLPDPLRASATVQQQSSPVAHKGSLLLSRFALLPGFHLKAFNSNKGRRRDLPFKISRLFSNHHINNPFLVLRCAFDLGQSLQRETLLTRRILQLPRCVTVGRLLESRSHQRPPERPLEAGRSNRARQVSTHIIRPLSKYYHLPFGC